MQRRSFLMGSLLAPTFCFGEEENVSVVSCDVLVIGAGAAGLSAAIMARGQNNRVILIDKNPSPFFSSSAYSAGSVNASGTLAQKQAGINDEQGLTDFANELFREGNFQNTPHLVENYVRNAAAALDWFTNRGVKLTPAPNIAFRMMRMHGCDRHTGSQYVEVLFEEAVRCGVQIWFQTKATRIVSENNRVLGVDVTRGRSALRLMARCAVVLCTGGFAGDVERVDAEIPDFRGASTFSSPSSCGEGLDMARDIGAASHLLSYAGAYAYGFPMDAETRRGLIYRGHVMNLYGSISLDSSGRRFVNDDLNSTKVAQRLAHLRQNTVYQLATEHQLDEFMRADPIQVIGWDRQKFLQETEDGNYFVVKSSSLSEIASKLDISREVLTETLDRYNRFVANGVDREFGRKCLKGKFLEGDMVFYAFRCRPVVGITIGGLVVDKSMQVLNRYGEPIEGLFAAGEMVGGLHGTSYIGGSSLGGALALGRFVGLQLRDALV